MSEAVALEVALKAVAPFMEKSLPGLSGVHVENGYAYTTDRYTLARAKHSHDEGVGGWLSAATVKMVLSSKSPVTQIDATGLTLGNGVRVPWDIPDKEFPNLERILNAHTPGQGGEMRFNPEFLARFVARNFPKENKNDAMVLTPGQDVLKPCKVTFSNRPWFVALVVPIRKMDKED